MSTKEGKVRAPDNSSRARPIGLRASLSINYVGPIAGCLDLAIIVLAAVGSAAIYHAIVLGTGSNGSDYAAIGGVCFLNFAVIGAARGAYQVDSLLHFRRQAWEVSVTWVVVVTLSLTFLFAMKVGGQVSRGAVGTFFGIGLVALLAWRRLLGRWMARALEAGRLGARHVVLIADRDELNESDTVHLLRSAGYATAACITYGPNESAKALDELVDKVVHVSRDEPVDAVIILANWSEMRTFEQLASSLRILPLPVYLLPDHRSARLLKDGMRTIAGLHVAQVQRAPLSMSERLEKRLFDVALASVGLVLLSPLLVMVALLVKLGSPGPVFFRQTRLGFNGRAFSILKFRSMTVSEEGPIVIQATRGDGRITSLGRLLRRTSIDELPQLWNVLKGDMSIVGPRPHAVAHDVEYEKSIRSYAFRHNVKPGLTGWAQVNGLRGETPTLDLMHRRIEYDLYYINNWSAWLDILIVLLTVRHIINDPNAF